MVIDMHGNKRGVRGGKKSSTSFKVVLYPKKGIRLSKTLDMDGIGIENRPSIDGIMPSIMERLEREAMLEMLEMAERWRNGYGGVHYGSEGDYDYDFYDMMYDGLGVPLTAKEIKRLNKRSYKKNGKPKKRYPRYDEDEDDFWSNRGSMFRNGEWSDEDEDEYGTYKCIKFYPDIENELSAIEFNDLKSFDDYCKEHGYHVGTVDYSNLVNNTVIHCCLDPIDKAECGENVILTDNSYGALYWTVSDDLSKYGSLLDSDLSSSPSYEDDEVSVSVVGSNNKKSEKK